MSNTISAPFRHDDEFRAIRIFDADTRHIATLHANFGAYKGGETTAPSHNDMRALAALFVAAPQMAEAAKRVLREAAQGQDGKFIVSEDAICSLLEALPTAERTSVLDDIGTDNAIRTAILDAA